jgi:hypothetical protein
MVNICLKKIFLFEIFEMVLQYIAFSELCTSANLTYIIMSYTLLVLNVVISPTILLCKNKDEDASKGKLKYAIYVFDSTLDALYLFTNIYRGGDKDARPEPNFFVNLALWYPSYAIILKMRAVRRTITVKQENRFDTRVFRDISTSITEKTTKANGGKLRKHVVEKFILLFVLIAGIILMGIHIGNFVVKYNYCKYEITAKLWESSSPIKMYSYGLWNINCGYHLIQNITANNKKINYIPKVIKQCTQLKYLSLRDNNIAKITLRIIRNDTYKFC